MQAKYLKQKIDQINSMAYIMKYYAIFVNYMEIYL